MKSGKYPRGVQCSKRKISRPTQLSYRQNLHRLSKGKTHSHFTFASMGREEQKAKKQHCLCSVWLQIPLTLANEIPLAMFKNQLSLYCLVLKVCMRWLSTSQVWAYNLGGKNPDISRSVDRRKAKFLNLGVPKIRNQNLCHYCEILFHFALVGKKQHKATSVVWMLKKSTCDYWHV